MLWTVVNRKEIAFDEVERSKNIKQNSKNRSQIGGGDLKPQRKKRTFVQTLFSQSVLNLTKAKISRSKTTCFLAPIPVWDSKGGKQIIIWWKKYIMFLKNFYKLQIQNHIS